uniref:ZU5 domain-containing protein n=1 Tax=Hanusia phi TaxID=3032 RepID=A0A7S0DZC0_9CRYP
MAAPAGKLEHPQTFPRTMRHLLDDNNSSNVGNQTLSETTSTVTLATMIDGYMTSNASVMNNSVFIDTSAPFSPETTAAPTTTTTTTTPTASSNTAQLPVGAVVIASETLTLPAEAVLQSQGFTMQFKSSSFANVGANIPAGAWPKDDRRVPTLQVVSLNLTAANISLPAQSRVGGPVIEYGPSGIKFLLPVRLALPISNTTVLGSSEELVVHVYNQSTFMWERRTVLSKNVPTPPAGIVYGETLSFSMYAALVVPKEKSSRKCGGGCIAGAVIGSIVGFGALVGGAWYFRQYQNKSSDGGVEERDSSGRGRTPARSQPEETRPAQQDRSEENTPRELHERTEEDEVEEARGAKKSAKKGSQEKEDSDEDDSHYYDV